MVTGQIQMGGGADVFADLITDRTLLDVINGTEKGAYNARDLNRTALAGACVRDLLEAVGYKASEAPTALWCENDIPMIEALDAHLEALKRLDLLNCGFDSSKLPATMQNLGYAGANAIEKMLFCNGRAAQRIPQAWSFCGEGECGM